MFYVETHDARNYIAAAAIESIYVRSFGEGSALFWQVCIRTRVQDANSFTYSEHDTEDEAKTAARTLIGQIQRAPLEIMQLQIHELLDSVDEAMQLFGVGPGASDGKPN